MSWSAIGAPIMAPLPDRSASGFLVAGVSPRRDLDVDYRAFIERAASHIATALINVRAFEQERKRAEALAEIDRAVADHGRVHRRHEVGAQRERFG